MMRIGNSFEILDSLIQHKTDWAWRATQEPNVRCRSGESDVSNSLTSDYRLGDYFSVLINGNFSRTDAFEFSVVLR